ncbi:hypothetical protein PROFUN_09756 [Planoprotostelium fungivorum]|uniref:Chloride channel protein n=1 Tax=Planoprotostelium fungivorum TaxID=1890364 RepID=A0A2P6NFE3_9EUKA|nr:hypothetical protein PROFUN_09756 [Planoprotostelium fungivorum]
MRVQDQLFRPNTSNLFKGSKEIRKHRSSTFLCFYIETIFSDERHTGWHANGISNITNQSSGLIEKPITNSLDYDEIESPLHLREIIANGKRGMSAAAAWKWIIFGFIGVLTGILAFGMTYITSKLYGVKFLLLKEVINNCGSCFWIPYLVLLSINAGAVLLSSCLVQFIEPAAGGSGVPQLKCFLNGIRIPKIVRMKTIIVKVLGLILAQSGGLILGKAATLIMAGATIAAGISQGQILTIGKNRKFLGLFREKRDFVAGGVSAGIAAAYGAPLGGLLFALEDSISFWKQTLIWRIFFTAVLCAFTMSFLLSGINGDGWGSFTQPGLVNFGKFIEKAEYNIYHLPFFALIGMMGGLFGSFFIHVNMRLAKLRYTYRTKRSWRIIEAVFVSILTTTICFTISAKLTQCKDIHDNEENWTHYGFYCPEGKFNELATLYFTPETTAVAEILHAPRDYSNISLLVFLFTFLPLACLTSGITVPSGTFIPSLLFGATFGRLAGQILQANMEIINADTGTFSLLGCAAMLSGMFRTPISLTAILIETTNDISYAPPIMFTVIVAKWIGDLFDDGIYNTWDPPQWMAGKSVSDVMSGELVNLTCHPTVEKVVRTLQECEHNGFPVVDEGGRLRGQILRSQLTVILYEGGYGRMEDGDVPEVALDCFRYHFPRFPELHEIQVDESELDMKLNLLPYVNPNPHTVTPNTNLSRAYRLFRSMGLRHLPVVNEKNQPVGMVTRKDLAFYSGSCEKNAEQQLEFSTFTS